MAMVGTALRRALFPAITSASLLAGGCMSADGPLGERVERHAKAVADTASTRQVPYCLVPLSPAVVDVALSNRPRLRGSLSGSHERRGVRFGVGDVVSVTLYEAATGGLFFPVEGSNRQGNYITIPNQSVDNNGNITVPYAGQVRAQGRTVVEIQDAIVSALKTRALEPQAVVTLVEQRAELLSVLGDVGTPIRFPASPAGERVLDAVARAGGLRGPGQESWVMLGRQGHFQTVPFEALIREPENNIAVQAQDTVYVYREPQTFLAFGAVTKQGQVPFDSWRITLSEAIAKAGGLVDIQAEPAYVFLYRVEPRSVVDKIDVKCQVNDGPNVPVIYQADLRDPSGFFLSSEFPMRNKDVLFVGNARSVEATKFMTFLQTVNTTVQAPISTGISGYTLKQLAEGTSNSSVIVATGH